MNHDEMIAVIQAHKEGKTLQFQIRRDNPNIREAWIDLFIDSISWNFERFEYRIKPEPPKPRGHRQNYSRSRSKRTQGAQLKP